jgi:hypothetical protein
MMLRRSRGFFDLRVRLRVGRKSGTSIQTTGARPLITQLPRYRNECPPADADHSEVGLDSRKRRRDRYAARAALWNASTLRSVRMCGLWTSVAASGLGRDYSTDRG